MEAKSLAQNVFIHLNNAVDAAAKGENYGDHWEKAMNEQTELLRQINVLRTKLRHKPSQLGIQIKSLSINSK